MEQNQVDRIVEAINENFAAQNVVLARVTAVLERMDNILKLTATTLTQRERKPDDDDVSSTGG